ncbi:MAG: class I tRNA ligase family protein [Slackia sp.]
MLEQVKRMGCSADLSPFHHGRRLCQGCPQDVRRLVYNDGLIYRGKRIVNWCPHCRTAISDDEAGIKRRLAICGTFAIR